MTIKLKTAPTDEPVTLEEARLYLRLSDTEDDWLVSALIKAIRQKFDEWSGRAVMTQTWTLWLDRFPVSERKNAPREGYFELPITHFDAVKRAIEIPRPPLQTVPFLKTYADDDTATTFAATNYFIDTASTPGRLVLNRTASWPVDLRPANAVEIEFVAGWGSVAASVPEPIRQGMLLWLKLLFADKSKLFENDESQSLAEMNNQMIPTTVKTLWQPYKLLKL